MFSDSQKDLEEKYPDAVPSIKRNSSTYKKKQNQSQTEHGEQANNSAATISADTGDIDSVQTEYFSTAEVKGASCDGYLITSSCK